MGSAAMGATFPVSASLAQQVPEVQQRQSFYFDIPATSLAEALSVFGQQAALQVSVHSDLVRNIQSPAVKGNIVPQKALEALLEGTSLTYQITGSVVTLQAIQKGAGKSVRRLAPISVSSADNGTTEGSGSYTTGPMNTATKLPLSIRETPQAITVITRQRMDDLGVVDMVDIIEKTPGLSINRYGVGRPLFYARGFSLNTVTEDGISNSFNSYVPSPLSNLAMYDRAEIVRGSTGLMQGAGNPSAAVNLFRKRPTDDFQAHVSGSVGSWNDFSVTADMSGALTKSGNIRGRIVGYVQDADNFRDVEKEKSQSIYATLDFDLSPDTTLNLGYSYLHSFKNMVWGGIPISSTGEHLNVPRSTFVGADWEYLKQDVNTLYASIDHTFDNSWNMRLNMKYANTVSDILATWLVLDEPNNGYGHIYWAAKDDTDQYGADLYASGPLTLFGRKHEAVIGASTNKEEQDREEFFDCFNETCALSTVSDIATWDASMATKPSLASDSPDRSESALSVSQKSLYSTIRWNLSDSLKFISGARLDWYENISPWSEVKADGHLTLYGGLIYDINQNHSFYISYTDIFNPQSNIDIQQKALKPIVGKNYEAGIKGEYFDGALNANIAVFQIDQANRAKRLTDQSQCPVFPGTSCYEATGLIRSQGVDFEIQGEVAQDWQIGTGYTYSHVEYVRDANIDRIGQRSDTGIPEHLFKFNTTYKLPDALNKWRIGAGLTYQSKIFYDLDTDTETVRSQQKGYALANAMVSYSPTERVNIQLNGNNLFDKTYYEAIGDDLYYVSTELYGEPRNFMLTLRYTW
jgi:outer membrane receptor for ferric coprogen and ferric-rhodotorulic acid